MPSSSLIGSGTPELRRLASANCFGTGRLTELKKYSSIELRRWSGSGSRHGTTSAAAESCVSDDDGEMMLIGGGGDMGVG